MADKEKCVEEFIKFTCASATEAKRYLENSAWNTEAALVMYFDDRDDRVDPSTLGFDAAQPENAAERDSENDSMHADEDEYVDVEAPQSFDFESSPEKKPDKSATAKPYKRSTNIATFSSIRNDQDDEEEDDDQLYYAGGSEHSGQQIMGNDRNNDMAGEVFRTLRQMVTSGGIEVAGPSREPGKSRLFSGVGYRLGQTTDDTQVIGAPNNSSDERCPELHLRLWRDGFTIGEEPLRSYTDPENKNYIDMLLRGEVPMHLVPPGSSDGKVNVKVEDVRHERYSGPTVGRHRFIGQGHVLGNVVPEVVVDKQQPGQEKKESDKAPEPIVSPIQVDDSKPTTNIAVRLPTGTRSQVKLNLTHTVEDLRTHLVSTHRELNGQVFVFMVSFPPKEVSDEKLTIEEAGLVNSSVHLRIKKD